MESKIYTSKCCSSVRWRILLERKKPGTNDDWLAVYLFPENGKNVTVWVSFSVTGKDQHELHQSSYRMAVRFEDPTAGWGIGEFLNRTHIEDYLVHGTLYLRVDITYVRIAHTKYERPLVVTSVTFKHTK